MQSQCQTESAARRTFVKTSSAAGITQCRQRSQRSRPSRSSRCFFAGLELVGVPKTRELASEHKLYFDPICGILSAVRRGPRYWLGDGSFISTSRRPPASPNSSQSRHAAPPAPTSIAVQGAISLRSISYCRASSWIFRRKVRFNSTPIPHLPNFFVRMPIDLNTGPTALG